MKDEIVDIVDESDIVIGNISKTEAHTQGILHRTVIAEVIDSQGKFLLVKQSKKRQDAGQYVSPVGGHVRSGESTHDALKREAHEELGLRNFKFRLKGKAIFNREIIGRRENHYLILYEIFCDLNPVLNEESVSSKRFTIEELKNSILHSPKIFGNAWLFVVRNFYPEFISGI